MLYGTPNPFLLNKNDLEDVLCALSFVNSTTPGCIKSHEAGLLVSNLVS